MDVKELRIGNLINFMALEQIISVECLIPDTRIMSQKEPNHYIVSNSHVPTITNLMCEPIPLTEQWLLDFGFDKPNLEWIIRHRETKFELALYQTVTAIYKDRYCLFYDGEPLEIKYVHQLQNLYFAMRGKELIK